MDRGHPERFVVRVPLHVATALALLTAACSAAPPWVAPEEHQRLVRRMLELERRAAQAELEIERLKHRLAEVEPLAAPASAPPPASIPSIRQTMPEVEEDTTAAGWRSTREPIEESELSEDNAGDARDPSTATNDYELGLMMLRDGRPGDAETTLARFATANPRSDLADNAWFWIGESRLSRNDMAGAIAAYRECLERYPSGNKVPDAMLKLGHALEQSGDRSAAREVWSELLRRYPSTAAAETARGRLSML